MQTVEELQIQELLLKVDVAYLPTRLCPTLTFSLKPPSLNPSPLHYHPARLFAPLSSYLTGRPREPLDGRPHQGTGRDTDLGKGGSADEAIPIPRGRGVLSFLGTSTDRLA
eukprot:gene22604-30874_t